MSLTVIDVICLFIVGLFSIAAMIAIAAVFAASPLVIESYEKRQNHKLVLDIRNGKI